jgi:toxin-antitoxin system PIN domain toxin
MKGYLLDVNVLIALAWPNHPQHSAAHAWFAEKKVSGWGTCMVTQLGFVRVSSHPKVDGHVSTQEAIQKLLEIIAVPGHTFWPEPADGYANKTFTKTLPDTLTHGQVTDAYLATVAELNGGKLATLDRSLARTFADLSILVGSPAA